MKGRYIPASDLTLIFAVSRARKHPAWAAFKREMAARCYGREPLNQAWAFFRDGWDAALNPDGGKK